MRLLALAVALLLTPLARAQDDWPKPTAVAIQAPVAPAIDGRLDDAAWAAADWNTDFVSASPGPENSGAPHLAQVQTRFKVAWDDAAIYLAVECDEPQIAGLKRAVTDHDAMVFTDDCIELFLDPSGVGRYYSHFVVNANGAWYDDSAADAGLVFTKMWDCPVTVATQVDEARHAWTIELSIPLGALSLPASPPAAWLWNVTRERYAAGAGELYTWAPLKNNFHQPRFFGKLTGIGADLRRFALSLAEPRAAVQPQGDGLKVDLAAQVTNESGAEVTLLASVAPYMAPAPAGGTPATLAAGSKADVSFPTFAVARDAQEAHVVLRLTDAASGALLKAAVKHIALAYEPLSIDLRRPVYRNCIFATETPKRIEFTLRFAPDLAGRAARAECRLLNEAGAVVRSQTVEGEAVGELITLEAADLPDGRYVLEVTTNEASGAALSAAQTTIRKLPPPAVGNEVRIDENRCVLVNGKPTVAIGWYGEVPTQDPREDVVALQNIQTPAVPAIDDPSSLRKPWDEHGIYSVVSMENGRFTYIFELWRQAGNPVPTEQTRLSAPSDEMRGLVRRLIASVQAEPGLIGYYIADEPEINNYRADYIEALYQLLVEEDPYHPVIVTNDTLDGIVGFGYRCSDILSPDPYSPDLDYVPNFLKRCHEVMRPGQAIWLTPWISTGQTHFTADWGSQPPYSYRVFRNQHLVSVAYDAKGWTGYTSPFFMPEIEYRYGLPYVWRELRFLEPALAAPAPAQKPAVQTDAELPVWIREAGGHVYIVAVNHKPGARSARISHPLLRGRRALTVVSEGREVEVTDGGFTEVFEPGDARIYTTDPAGAGFTTTTQIEAELARRITESAKPGNLLHVSRGVRASASEGYYAPWFNQYYYYAINGITDDLGWCASHAGDKPSWVELTLPAPAQVGRVVIYTPNLRDYDLQLQGPDGTTWAAEVRGNMDTMVEHNFAVPVDCLKLRITQLAAREGKATVAEVEAYERPGEGPLTDLRQTAAALADVEGGVFPEAAGDNALWQDDFTDFQPRDSYKWDGTDTAWVRDPARISATQKPGGGVVLRCIPPTDGAGMSHMLPYDPQHRWLQVKLGMEGEGYKFVSVNLGRSSGEPGFRPGVNTNRPGIYTVDTHYINDKFRTGATPDCFLTTYSGQIDASFDWVRLVQRPVDGLAVTLGDGSPLPEVLHQGDELLLRLVLDKPATDAVVEALSDYAYNPLPLNGQPYVQLVKVGEKDGREWAARVTLGEGTGRFDQPKSGYPLVFRARIVGGAIPETWATAAVSVQ